MESACGTHQTGFYSHCINDGGLLLRSTVTVYEVGHIKGTKILAHLTSLSQRSTEMREL